MSVQRRIVLLLDDEGARYARAQSRQLTLREPSFFTLDAEQNVPHITLVGAEALQGADSSLEAVVTNLTSGMGLLELPFVELHDIQGWVMAKVKETETIVALRNRLVETLVTDQTQRVKPYLPHVTLTRIKHFDDGVRVAASVDWTLPIIRANAIAICESGEHGECVRVLWRKALVGTSNRKDARKG